MHILIIGAGFGGLTLANALQSHPGLTISIYERHTTPNQELAGYGLHIGADGKRALKRCLSPQAYENFLKIAVTAGSKWAFRDTNLEMLALRDDAVITGKEERVVERLAMHRGPLRGVLLSGLEDNGNNGNGNKVVIHWGKQFTHHTKVVNDDNNNNDTKIIAHFSDGTTSEPGDILIGADGSNSKVRAQLLPDINREDLGILTICGRYQLDEARTKSLPTMMTDGSLNNIVPWGLGWLFIASFPEVKANGDDDNETQTENYTLWAYILPKSHSPSPPNAAKNLTPEEMRDMALKGVQSWKSSSSSISPHLETIIRDADLTTVTPIILRSMPHLPPWPPSQVTVLGDAIHNMTPMAGVGANIALRDAHVLADSILDAHTSGKDGKGVVEAIGKYEEEMRRYANDAVALSREIAEGAGSDSWVGRWVFRGVVVWLAGRIGWVMRRTIGRGGFGE